MSMCLWDASEAVGVDAGEAVGESGCGGWCLFICCGCKWGADVGVNVVTMWVCIRMMWV